MFLHYYTSLKSPCINDLSHELLQNFFTLGIGTNIFTGYLNFIVLWKNVADITAELIDLE